MCQPYPLNLSISLRCNNYLPQDITSSLHTHYYTSNSGTDIDEPHTEPLDNIHKDMMTPEHKAFPDDSELHWESFRELGESEAPVCGPTPAQ